jgi:hypothetical protein
MNFAQDIHVDQMPERSGRLTVKMLHLWFVLWDVVEADATDAQAIRGGQRRGRPPDQLPVRR